MKSNSKKLLLALGLLNLALAFSTVYLVHYYGETRPVTAQPGRTHAASIHSRTVYLSGGEYGLAMTIHVLTVLGIGLFLGMLLRSRRKTA